MAPGQPSNMVNPFRFSGEQQLGKGEHDQVNFFRIVPMWALNIIARASQGWVASGLVVGVRQSASRDDRIPKSIVLTIWIVPICEIQDSLGAEGQRCEDLPTKLAKGGIAVPLVGVLK